MGFIKFCQQKAEEEGMLAYLMMRTDGPPAMRAALLLRTKYREKYLRLTTKKLTSFPKEEAIEKGLTYLLHAMI